MAFEMMKKILVAVMLVISLIGGTCFAADWHHIADSDSESYYFDADSITADDNTVSVWIRDDGSNNTRRIVYWKIDDDGQAYTIMGFYKYDKNGKATTSESGLNQRYGIVPGTYGELIVKTILKYVWDNRATN